MVKDSYSILEFIRNFFSVVIGVLLLYFLFHFLLVKSAFWDSEDASFVQTLLYLVIYAIGSFVIGNIICFLSTRKTYLHIFFSFIVTMLLVGIKLIADLQVYWVIVLPILAIVFVVTAITLFSALFLAYRFYGHFVKKHTD